MKRDLEKRYLGYMMEAYYYTVNRLRKHTPPSKKFLILCFPRTGSNQLVSMLNSHPDIHCDNELLINRLSNPMRFINSRASSSNKPVFGFKLQAHHLALQKIRDDGTFVRELFDAGYKIIQLTRRNYFRAALSLNYAASVGKFHYMHNDSSDTYRKISLDPQELYRRIEWIELQNDLIARWTSSLGHLSLTYEDDLLQATAQQAATERVLDYLNLPHENLKGKFVKMKSEDIGAFLANAEEIKSLLATSRFAHFLEED